MERNRDDQKRKSNFKFVLVFMVSLIMIVFIVYRFFVFNDGTNSNNYISLDKGSISEKVKEEKDKEITKQTIKQFDDTEDVIMDENKTTEEHYQELHGKKEYNQALEYAKKYADITSYFNGEKPTQSFRNAKKYMSEDHLTLTTAVPPRATATMQHTKPLKVEVSTPKYLESTYVNDYQIVFEVYKQVEITDIDGNKKKIDERSQLIMVREDGLWKVGEVF